MNEERRKKIKEALEIIDRGLSILNEVKDEEQEAFDNLPENMQSGEKGEAMENAIATLDSAADNIDSAVSDLGSIE